MRCSRQEVLHRNITVFMKRSGLSAGAGIDEQCSVGIESDSD